MTYKLFNKLWKDALDQTDAEMYIGEYGYPEWFKEVGEDLYDIVKKLVNIYEVAHMPFREIIKRSGMSRPDFCERLRKAQWISGPLKTGTAQITIGWRSAGSWGYWR